MLRTEHNDETYNEYWYGRSSYANGNGFDDWYRDEFEGIKLSNLAIVPVQIKLANYYIKRRELYQWSGVDMALFFMYWKYK